MNVYEKAMKVDAIVRSIEEEMTGNERRGRLEQYTFDFSQSNDDAEEWKEKKESDLKRLRKAEVAVKK